VCLSVLGSPTTRRVRRSSDNWRDTPAGMPHNPEGASLHPIECCACAAARPTTRTVGHSGCFLAWRPCEGEPQHPESAPLDPNNLRTTPHPGAWRSERAPVRADKGIAQPDGCVNLRKSGGAHNQRRLHDRGARPRRVLHPATRHAAQENVRAKKKGAHNPKGASTPENRAARTTKGVRSTGEHDPEGCFTQKPAAPHGIKWAQKRKGRTTRRVRQPQKTGRRAQPKACARQGSTTQKGSSPSNPTRRTRECTR